MVDLRAKPYYLSDSDIAWVENTIADMTAEEKVGQLFWQLTAGNSEEYLQELMEKYHLGGCRYNAMPGQMVLRTVSCRSTQRFPYSLPVTPNKVATVSVPMALLFPAR